MTDLTNPERTIIEQLRAWVGKNGYASYTGEQNGNSGPEVVDCADLLTELDQLIAESAPAEGQPSDAAKWADAVCKAVEAMDLKMTQYGSGEWVEAYMVPAGPWHLLLGLVRGGLWPEYTNDKLRDAEQDATQAQGRLEALGRADAEQPSHAARVAEAKRVLEWSWDRFDRPDLYRHYIEDAAEAYVTAQEQGL